MTGALWNLHLDAYHQVIPSYKMHLDETSSSLERPPTTPLSFDTPHHHQCPHESRPFNTFSTSIMDRENSTKLIITGRRKNSNLTSSIEPRVSKRKKIKGPIALSLDDSESIESQRLKSNPTKNKKISSKVEKKVKERIITPGSVLDLKFTDVQVSHPNRPQSLAPVIAKHDPERQYHSQVPVSCVSPSFHSPSFIINNNLRFLEHSSSFGIASLRPIPRVDDDKYSQHNLSRTEKEIFQSIITNMLSSKNHKFTPNKNSLFTNLIHLYGNLAWDFTWDFLQFLPSSSNCLEAKSPGGQTLYSGRRGKNLSTASEAIHINIGSSNEHNAPKHIVTRTMKFLGTMPSEGLLNNAKSPLQNVELSSCFTSIMLPIAKTLHFTNVDTVFLAHEILQLYIIRLQCVPKRIDIRMQIYSAAILIATKHNEDHEWNVEEITLHVARLLQQYHTHTKRIGSLPSKKSILLMERRILVAIDWRIHKIRLPLVVAYSLMDEFLRSFLYPPMELNQLENNEMGECGFFVRNISPPRHQLIKMKRVAEKASMINVRKVPQGTITCRQKSQSSAVANQEKLTYVPLTSITNLKRNLGQVMENCMRCEDTQLNVAMSNSPGVSFLNTNNLSTHQLASNCLLIALEKVLDINLSRLAIIPFEGST